MSARQPFFPPELYQKPEAFAPDPNNPLHRSATLVQPMGRMRTGSITPFATPGLRSGSETLREGSKNTSGLGSLMKKNSSSSDLAVPNFRPGTADPHARGQKGATLDPLDVRPLAAPAAKFPARPISVLSGFLQDSEGKKAHIFTDNQPQTAVDDGKLPEQPMETDALFNVQQIKFRGSTSANGPRRVSAQGSLGSHGAGGHTNGVLSGHEVTDNGFIKQNLNGSTKRNHEEVDHREDDSNVDDQAKRHKSSLQPGPRDFRGDVYPRQDTFSPQPDGPASRHRQDGYTHFQDHPPQQTRSLDPAASDNRFNHQLQPSNEQPVLNKLFGRDVDHYVREHMGDYDRAVSKWTDCTMSEWSAGAEEIASKVGKMLDFVKDHMTTKLKTFSDLRNTLDNHNSVLVERDQLLSRAQQRLVLESGQVLGKKGPLS